MFTKENIIKLPHSNLRKKSKNIAKITTEVKNLIQNMELATLDWELSRDHEVGVALAAVQINELYRVVIIRTDFDNKDDKSFQIFINPTIVQTSGDLIEDYEGCLSVKDIYGLVKRHSMIRVKAKNINGKIVIFNAEGFLARVFQHEIDHTNGILFVDHIKDQKDSFYELQEDGHLKQLNNKRYKELTKDLW